MTSEFVYRLGLRVRLRGGHPVMVRVLLIDDEPRLRQAWEKFLGPQADLKLVGALGCVGDLSAMIAEYSPDVIVIDLSLPGADPFESISGLAALAPEVKAIVYSARSDLDAKRAALDAGAWAFVDKLSEPSEVCDVIRRVARGELVMPSDLEG